MLQVGEACACSCTVVLASGEACSSALVPREPQKPDAYDVVGDDDDHDDDDDDDSGGGND